jgi:hypothetical protein
LNILKETTKINALFLTIVLIAGTITAIYPSFVIGAQAQGDPYYQIDNRYNSYEPEPEYSPQYPEKKYNSYEPELEYGMDSYKKSYRNDNYEQPEYPSYQPDYKPEYPSYENEKDDSYKSKDSSITLNKLNCINNNVNINGNNTGDINVGNSGRSATGSGTDGEGYLGFGSVGDNGEGGYDNNAYNKQKDQGFECIITNNNNNTINVGAGNATTPVPLTCEECFGASATLAAELVDRLNDPGTIIIVLPGDRFLEIGAEVDTIEDFCIFLEGLSNPLTDIQLEFLIASLIINPAAEAEIDALIECLLEVGGVIVDTTP